MGLASNVLGGIQATPAVMTPQGSAPITPQAAPQAPQFNSPTAAEILSGLLTKFGQQSIAPQAPGAQGTNAVNPQLGNGQGQSALQQLTGKSGTQMLGQGLNYLTNGAISDVAQNGLSQGLGFAANPAGTYGPFQGGAGNDLSNLGSAISNGVSNAGSALMSIFG